MRPHAPLALLACAVAACGEPVDGAAWRFRFADASLAARAEVVRTEIRAGGCDGSPVFVTRVSPSTPGETPPELSPGHFGFYGRARDATCTWYAEGCTEANLPSTGSIEVVLNRAITGTLDPECLPGESSQDPVAGPVSAGGGESDAGGGESDAGSTGGADPAPATIDVSAPKCTSLDTQVVACFDFNRSLSDASSFHNDVGPASDARFEAAQSGEGLRVDGKTLAAPDAASLNVSALTVEVWLRADGLVNLDGQVSDNSLVLDKDQQYNVGFNAQGALHMEVYRALNDAESTTAAGALLTLGKPAYAAFVYDAGVSRIYLDGVLRASEAVGLTLFRGNGGTMHIGSGSPSATRPFDGLIDALRISNVARSDVELCDAAGRVFSAGLCQ